MGDNGGRSQAESYGVGVKTNGKPSIFVIRSQHVGLSEQAVAVPITLPPRLQPFFFILNGREVRMRQIQWRAKCALGKA